MQKADATMQARGSRSEEGCGLVGDCMYVQTFSMLRCGSGMARTRGASWAARGAAAVCLLLSVTRRGAEGHANDMLKSNSCTGKKLVGGRW